MVSAHVRAGITGNVHFHHLRHTGNALAPQSGASTRELMTRMGHSTTRGAALIYQHMTSDRDRDRAIADRMGEAARRALGEQDSPEVAGTDGAREDQWSGTREAQAGGFPLRPGPLCVSALCPRQDSNLRHRL